MGAEHRESQEISVLKLSVNLGPVWALTFESLDLETLFLVCRYTLKYSYNHICISR